MKKWLIAILLLLPLLYFGFSWYLSGLIQQGPPRRDIPTAFAKLKNDWNIDRDSILQTLPAPEEVTFPGTPLPASPVFEEGSPTMYGWIFSSGKDTASCAVLLAHGFTDNRSGMLKYTAPYRNCGCELLLYDHRAHYLSGNDNLITGGIYEAKDVEAAHRYLAKRYRLNDQQIGWVGESWGAAAVLIAGGDDNIRPAFIATDSPYADWETAIAERAVKSYGGWINAFFAPTFFLVDQRLEIDHTKASPERAAADIQVPTLIVHSAADVETSPDQSQRIYDNFGRKELAQLELLDWGSWHAQSAARRPAQYSRIVKDFIQRNAPEFCASTVDPATLNAPY
jgi:pimeloyl-ACP methyl ester carboxylesterase